VIVGETMSCVVDKEVEASIGDVNLCLKVDTVGSRGLISDAPAILAAYTTPNTHSANKSRTGDAIPLIGNLM
jgi:hypothetical protein